MAFAMGGMFLGQVIAVFIARKLARK